MFWIVTNIPGNSVRDGNEVVEYLTPFAVAPREDGTLEKNILASNHPTFFLAFKQLDGRIVMEETQAGCTQDLISSRVAYYTDLAEKYNLEMVAGNFYQNPWSGFWTEQMLCNATRCIIITISVVIITTVIIIVKHHSKGALEVRSRSQCPASTTVLSVKLPV